MSFITFGEIMLRLSPAVRAGKISDAQAFSVGYAGSESNVASSLAILGNEVQFVTKLPTGQVGDGAVRSLNSFGIDTSSILRQAGRMGTYFIELGSSIRPSSVIYDRENAVIARLQPGEFDWEAILRDREWIFISGITPALSDQCARETILLAATARKMGVKVSFDFNFRRTLWDDSSEARAIFDQILPHTDLLFGNTGSLQDVYGNIIEGRTPSEQTSNAMEYARRTFGVNQLAFTMRNHASASSNQLSARFFSEGQFYQSAEYSVEITDRFGTGDAFAAGCLHGLHQQWDTQKVIDFATAAFALKHTIAGDQHTSSEQEIFSIMEGHTSGHVIR